MLSILFYTKYFRIRIKEIAFCFHLNCQYTSAGLKSLLSSQPERVLQINTYNIQALLKVEVVNLNETTKFVEYAIYSLMRGETKSHSSVLI